MRDDLWGYLEGKLQKDPHEEEATKELVPQSINALRNTFEKNVKPNTVGGAARHNEIKAKFRLVYEYVKSAKTLLNQRIVFPEAVGRRAQRLFATSSVALGPLFVSW